MWKVSSLYQSLPFEKSVENEYPTQLFPATVTNCFATRTPCFRGDLNVLCLVSASMIPVLLTTSFDMCSIPSFRSSCTKVLHVIHYSHRHRDKSFEQEARQTRSGRRIDPCFETLMLSPFMYILASTFMSLPSVLKYCNSSLQSHLFIPDSSDMETVLRFPSFAPCRCSVSGKSDTYDNKIMWTATRFSLNFVAVIPFRTTSLNVLRTLLKQNEEF